MRRDVPVTLLIPTFNEESHIDACLESVARQTYDPQAMEVLVIDGRSTDATRERVRAWSGRIPNLRLLDNPGRHQSNALNLGLDRAAHEYIVRLDAHTVYAPDYVERCVDALLRSDAVVVGGPMRPVGVTPFGQAVALATTTPFGVGPGRFHYSEEEEYVDTVYLGAFRRRDVQAVGGYDETLRPAGEDHELNFRIRKAGGRILLDPSITSWYRPRSRPRDLWRQYWRYGSAKVATLLKHRALPTWRPLAPALLVAGVVLGAVASLVLPVFRLWAAAVASYLAAVVLVAAVRAKGRPALAWRTALAIVIMHVSYGLGVWVRLASAGIRSLLPGRRDAAGPSGTARADG